ncbi:Nonribosomal peptide synthetase 7 [Cytospora mali]|uniref:Nonribosomal peptide synthetase 7 n=1 Tax=Cytospora mali TaxID=578113 RepID=A0A194VP66_CYTMA|nr:Nonribosomal peptide synthetase 7 [Valsa mali]
MHRITEDHTNVIEVVAQPCHVKTSSTAVNITMEDITASLESSNGTEVESESDLSEHNRNSDSSKTFWAESLSNIPELAIHGIPVERHQEFQKAIHDSPVAINPSSLRSVADYLGVTINAVVYTAFGLVLYRHSQASSGTVIIAVKGDDEVYPLKLQLPPTTLVSEAIRQTYRLDTISASHAFIGYDNIRSEHTAAACDFKVAVAHEQVALEVTDDDFPISILLDIPQGQSISVITRHDTAISATKLQVILDHFVTALTNMVKSPELPLSEIDIISNSERALLLEKSKPKTKSVRDNIHRIFERQVELTPDVPALQFENSKPLSYVELNAAANRVARRIPSVRGSFVPVCQQRSANLIVSLVAILKTGAAYVVLDPETPQERNNFIVDDIGADFIIVDRSTSGRFAHELVIEDVMEQSSRAKDTNLGRICDPDDPVYVIYTSGSTGKPKGVLHGGCLCLASKDNLTTHIGRTINQMQINVIDVTPSTALLIEPGTVPCLRRMTVAGELINPALIPTWAGKLELLNAYGLSENTQVNWRRRMIPGQNPQSIGRPSDTTSSYVLVPGTTQLSPLLIPGELCLGGHQLAVHYINRPEKTAEAFIANPFAPGRLYRTGDMVVAHEDGSIEMVGRIDFQVKINGQRVEPGDSNAIIQTHGKIHTSSVVSATVGARKALVAVVVTKVDNVDWPVLRSELKSLLKQHIAGYMTPSYWLVEKELPLNINGKVDIPRLVKYVESLGRDYLLESSIGRTSKPNPPSSQVPNPDDNKHNLPEELSADASRLRDIWATVLGLETSCIRTQDHFQELGGSSFDAIRVASRAYQANLRVSVASILRLPLSKILIEPRKVGLGDELSDITPFSLLLRNSKLERTGIDDAFPTTALQDAFLADSLLGSSTYVYRRYYRMQGCRSSDIQATLKSLIPSYPLLRTTFLSDKSSFLQVIRRSAELSWEDLDISAEEFSLMPRRKMEQGGNFVCFSNLRDQVLAITMHHALFDFWSKDFLIDDLVSALEGRPILTRPSYAGYVHHLKQQNKTEMQEFWKSKLQGAVPSHLGYSGDENNVVTIDIPNSLQDIATSQNVSVPSLIYAAWGLILYMHTSKNDVTFGVTLSGRDAPVSGILRMPGPTISTIPFRTLIDPDKSLFDLARTIQGELWAWSGPAKLGIRDILKVSGHKTGLYDTMVNILTRDYSESTSRVPALIQCGPQEPNHIEVTMLEAELKSTGIQLRLLSRIQRDKASFIIRNVAEILNMVVRHPSVVPQLVLADINPTSTEEVLFLDSLSKEKPTEPNILAHTLIEKMASLHPDKTALQDMRGTKISYHDFNTYANNLSRHLLSKGATTDSIIPICLEKSPDTLIAILAVLKSGAAFTPLDPKNSKDRNDFIVSDAGAAVAITNNTNARVFAGFDGHVVNMDCLPILGKDSTYSLPDNLSPNKLAYVIYTSGSTGIPKGVQVSHAAVAASTEGMIEACNVNENWHVLWFLNYVFDASYFDVFTVLGSGGTISLADQETMVNDLAGCVNHFQVKQLMITPTIARLISPDEVPTLQALLVCGEPITPDVVSQWASRMDVYNGYGPTEATILMTVSKVKTDGSLESIGYPLKAVKASVLHPRTLKPVPYGAVGELCVSGTQVAMGYLNRPEITASSFKKMEDGTIIYRTGDIARWLPNGELECLGRKDSQIKLNGFRIELGEIESVILQKAGDLIESCVVGVAQIRKKAGLVVYYVPVETPEVL